MKFLSLFKFVLYTVSSLVGIAGLWVGGWPVLLHLLDRMSGGYSVEYDVLFQQAMILIGSLILLIAVHLGHSLANAFEIEKRDPRKSPEQPAGNLAGTPWDPNRKSSNDASDERAKL